MKITNEQAKKIGIDIRRFLQAKGDAGGTLEDLSSVAQQTIPELKSLDDIDGRQRSQVVARTEKDASGRYFLWGVLPKKPKKVIKTDPTGNGPSLSIEYPSGIDVRLAFGKTIINTKAKRVDIFE